MKIDYEVKGIKRLMKSIDRVSDIVEQLYPVMFELSLILANDAREFVRGRTALDKYQKEAAMESANEFIGNIADEGLGVVSNRLRSSIFAAVDDMTKEYVTAIIRTNVEYALIHEIGGTIITKYAVIQMPARPYMYAALLKNENLIKKRLSEEIKRILKDSTK